jgi:hypothetical protein
MCGIVSIPILIPTPNERFAKSWIVTTTFISLHALRDFSWEEHHPLNTVRLTNRRTTATIAPSRRNTNATIRVSVLIAHNRFILL